MDLGKAIGLTDLDVNPYPIYKQLRDTETIIWVDVVNRWMVTRWEDVIYVDTHPEIFSTMETDSLQTRVMGRTMLRTDGAAHKRLRQAVEAAMRPKVVRQQWYDWQCQVANDLIDGFIGRGETDLVKEFAVPFAACTLKYVLGLPTATNEDMQRWSQDLIDGCGNYADDPAVWARAERAAREIELAIDENLPRVRLQPDGSVLSSMLHTPVDPPLSLREIYADIKLFIGGGLNEPRDMIGIALWGLLTHPKQAAFVRNDPALLKDVVEEAMRWISPIGMYPRQTTCATEIAGTPLEKGARLAILVSSANRDERHWEKPDTFDINRSKSKHLAFGLGSHYCLGAWLARQQLAAVALPALLTRLPDLRLNLDQPPLFRGWVFRGTTHLHVQWSHAAN
jgi:cytochrome P450